MTDMEMMQAVEASDTVTVSEQDQFGNDLCRDFKAHHVYKGKVVFKSETQVWRVSKKMTQKEIRNGKYNPAFPLGPYECAGAMMKHGTRHWHIGHASENIGRKPSLRIMIQIWIEDSGKKVEKIRRQLRNRITYHWNKI